KEKSLKKKNKRPRKNPSIEGFSYPSIYRDTSFWISIQFLPPFVPWLYRYTFWCLNCAQ
ncbi:hypothetical protein LINGRAHAP2_LOCUS13909, partial [Linum grandiflorum]